ncbi:hypothetical protein R1flu_017683 [Riccia fluitans]|uniref:Uncharacterized protein n=1 Tax=Riccia fluitans TaxID=41844 RepID=A0ABD1ZDY4_9MARC
MKLPLAVGCDGFQDSYNSNDCSRQEKQVTTDESPYPGCELGVVRLTQSRRFTIGAVPQENEPPVLPRGFGQPTLFIRQK